MKTPISNSFSITPGADGDIRSADPNGVTSFLLFDDFSNATTLNSLLVSNGGKWNSFENNNPGQLAIEQYPLDASKKCLMMQYVNSGDQDLLRSPDSGGKTHLFYQWREYRETTWDAAASKEIRWFDPITGIDLYLTINASVGSTSPGVVDTINQISFNVQGTNFVPGPLNGGNTYWSQPLSWDFSRDYVFTFEIKLNTQGVADGELRCWVNNVLVNETTGIKISDDAVSNYTLKEFQLGMDATNAGNPFDGVTKRYITDVKITETRPF